MIDTDNKNDIAQDNPQWHACIACPLEVRALYAAAHNACGAVERASNYPSEWPRAMRKIAELRAEIDRFKPIVDAHFRDVGINESKTDG